VVHEKKLEAQASDPNIHTYRVNIKTPLKSEAKTEADEIKNATN